MDFSNYLFRCSQTGLLMTDSRTKSEKLSETTKTNLKEIFIEKAFGRRKLIASKEMEKGNYCEEDSLTLLTQVTGELYMKNKEKLSNTFICGTPDIITKNYIIDIKTSWDIWTFSNAEVEKNYYWQLQSYMWLTGVHKAKLIYCLVDTPEWLIDEELKRLAWNMKVIDPSTDEKFQEACDQVIKNMTYQDINPSARVKAFEILFDESEIEKLQQRILDCREYLSEMSL